jgi:hypothetical protein
VAFVLLQLKLAIQRRALGRSGGAQRAWFVLTWVLALVLGLATGAVVEMLASTGYGLGDLGLILLLTVVFLAWALSPILLPGLSDETVDPERLEQFPLRARDQVAGLLLGCLVAPTALFTFLVAAGGTFASGESGSARVAVLLAAAVFTVLCVSVSRALTAVMAGVFRSRRARDVVIAATAVMGLALYLMSRSAHNLTDVLMDLENNSIEQVLSWLPPGAIGQGMIAVRDGDWATAALHLVVALLGIVLALAGWAWAIRRRVKGSSGAATRKRRASTTSGQELELVPLPLAALPSSPLTAAASQQLRYFFFRQPRALQSTFLLPVMGVVIVHSSIAEAGLTIGIVTFVVMSTFALASNLLGFDDRGFSYLLSAGAPLHEVLRGKALVVLGLLLPLTGVVIAAESVLHDLWGEALAALLGGAQVALVCTGIGAVLSVMAPQNRARAGGARGAALAVTLGGLVLMLATGLAFVVVWLLFEDSVNPTLLALATLPVAVVISVLLMNAAGGWLTRDPWRVQQRLHP